MCSRLDWSSTTSAPSRRKTTSTGLEEQADSEEKELPLTSSFPRMLVSSRTFRTITTRRLTKCQPISTSCETDNLYVIALFRNVCKHLELRDTSQRLIRDKTSLKR